MAPAKPQLVFLCASSRGFPLNGEGGDEEPRLVTGLSALAWHERKLPFLAIETDGNPFPQLIEARMEAFCLQAQRLNEQMLACGAQGH